ncbi:MAG TPA: alpha/beta fold hydrolase [Candidatus Limnocylindrales bacterium]
MTDGPSRIVRAPDGTAIADWISGTGRPLVVVHGAAADHTTFRVLGPLLARRFTIHAIDRRGRGASGDGPDYAIHREYDDLATIVDGLAREAGGPVDVVGHSFGGRIGLGAALRTSHLRRLVVYEGAPAPPDQPYRDAALVGRLRTLAGEGRNEELFETFLRQVVGMTPAELADYRANPVWPARVAAAPTIVRELEAESSPAAGLDVLGRVGIPVLQVLGGASVPAFRAATEALDARLAHGRVVVIDGAKHAAHHTHAARLAEEIERFLEA